VCVGWSTLSVAASLRRASLLALLLLVIAGCRSGADAARHDRAARVEPRLGELLLVGFHGTSVEDNPDVERLLCRARVGGVILFARNIVDAEQLARLTRALTERARECTGRTLLIAVDAEGGRVMRLGPGAGYTATLSHQDLGDANDLAQTELEARRIGTMLREAGINWNLAPVVDVGYNPANPVIVGVGRSFGANPARVAAQARAYIAGMHAAGLLTALKHFPGHGSSVADSHLGFVDVTETASSEVELAPYRMLLAEDAVDSVMTAHVFNRRLDRRYPATLSRPTITGLLRRDLGWRGVVVSDDMRMGAIEQHYGLKDAAVRAVRAGVDVVLIADDRLPGGQAASDQALDALRKAVRRGKIRAERVDEALARIDRLRARLP
jgi:beta-N-acetylhexosaminidase